MPRAHPCTRYLPGSACLAEHACARGEIIGEAFAIHGCARQEQAAGIAELPLTLVGLGPEHTSHSRT